MAHATRSILSPIPKITTREELQNFAAVHGLRPDWHEPDEQGVTAWTYGAVLDNAMGAGWVPDDSSIDGEINVILIVNGVKEAVINLAELLAWAADPGRL
jgi:hypothetical protein